MSYGEELGKLAREINANAKKNRNKRPVVVHKHAKGNWIIPNTKFKGYRVVETENQRITKLTATDFNSDEELESTARLISQAPVLLQIAEMYFDSMQGKGMENSIPYKVTLETLKKINPK